MQKCLTREQIASELQFGPLGKIDPPRLVAEIGDDQQVLFPI